MGLERGGPAWERAAPAAAPGAGGGRARSLVSHREERLSLRRQLLRRLESELNTLPVRTRRLESELKTLPVRTCPWEEEKEEAAVSRFPAILLRLPKLTSR